MFHRMDGTMNTTNAANVPSQFSVPDFQAWKHMITDGEFWQILLRGQLGMAIASEHEVALLLETHWATGIARVQTTDHI